jgi:uncharacterized protein (TIGR02145 family)
LNYNFEIESSHNLFTAPRNCDELQYELTFKILMVKFNATFPHEIVGEFMKNFTTVFIVIMMLVMAFTASVFAQGVPCPGTPTVIYAGKTYNTVQIGSQCWLKENLDVGTMISGSKSQNNNDTIEKYCYNNNPAMCDTFGGLYQWDEVMQYDTTEGTQGICPSGWHIPTLAEFETLYTTVGGDGNALKEIGQGGGAGVGTNTSGFSALLSGYRNYFGYFNNLGYSSVFWSSTEYNTYHAFFMNLGTNDSVIILYYYDNKGYGFSVRCVNDIAVGVDDNNKSELPKEFFLSKNYPNPFNPQTKISFSVPKESFITLKIYDLLGREVATLVQDKKQQGEYSVTWNADNVPSGVYFYKLLAGDFIETKKMVLMK